MRLFMLALALVAAPLARAAEPDDKAREADLFGGDAQKPAEPAPKAEDTSSREDDMFGGDAAEEKPAASASSAPASEDERQLERIDTKALDEFMDETADKLALGARLFTTTQYNALQRGAWKDFALQTSTLFDTYLDGRPNERVRVYARGRLTYQPSVVDGSVNATTGQVQSTLGTSLDQLWLKWDAEKKVYFTLGRQRVKWGAGRFWNPTDFLNQQRLDALAIIDPRLGTTLFKVHLPIESKQWNFYAVANLSGASKWSDLGAALRAELLFGNAEIALTGAWRKAAPAQQLRIPTIPGLTADAAERLATNLAKAMPEAGDTHTLVQLGADISAAVGPFDLHVEAAVQHGVKTLHFTGPVDLAQLFQLQFTPNVELPVEYRDEVWQPQVVVGGEYSFQYSEEDSIGLGLEYFYNANGYAGSKTYAGLLSQGLFTPFYLGQHYIGAYATAFNPGSWNNTTFVLSVLGNLSDNSYVTRLNHSVTILTNLSWTNFAQLHFGSTGEFRFGGNLFGFNVVPPLFELGTAFVVNM